MKDKRIVIVGAGPGGLTSAMILAHRGFRVTVVEKSDRVGGRNGELRVGDYSHDIGPTFLMMKFILDEVFEEAGKQASDYMEFVKLDPMYNLVFPDFSYQATNDIDHARSRLKEIFPGQERGIDLFMERESERFFKTYPPLQSPYHRFRELFRPKFLRAIPHLSLGRSLYQTLGRYFDSEKMRVSFSFQAKYMGMSPWECPAVFAIIPLIEYRYGIYHVMGGLNMISSGMARAAGEEGAEIRLGTPVKRLVVRDRTVKGVELGDGEVIEADDVIVNADFGYAMTNLVEPGILRKYRSDRLAKKKLSCSGLLIYLGLDRKYDMPFHNIVFADNYRENIDDVTRKLRISSRHSFYVRNASLLDPGLAPEGHSSVYVLVPVANNRGGINWEKETGAVRDQVLEDMAARTPMSDVRDHIVAERIITPAEWETGFNVYQGAIFNLGHNVAQMLYWRPRNKFEELDHCYLVGGGTHPGSGLPTIYESGRITSNLISEYYGQPVRPPGAIPR